ncbi:hypothetical protein VNO78_27611 [Psophocarpus tetragonolobus]|uniref:Disease resistance N-terminal domain-containing protein n=1 Tax=Psophocarpus tetragonolobus TaxID=3891 RepID=A0AAN9S1U8_PSOTE
MQQLQDFAVSLASDYLLPHLKKATNTVMNVPKDVADMKNTLNGIQGLIHEKDKVAAAEEDKAKVKQLVETCFHMEDIVDEYTVNEEKQLRDDPRCVALPCKAVDSVKATISRVKFAYLNEGVKLEFGENMSSNGSDVASLNSTVENLRPEQLQQYLKVEFSSSASPF